MHNDNGECGTNNSEGGEARPSLAQVMGEAGDLAGELLRRKNEIVWMRDLDAPAGAGEFWIGRLGSIILSAIRSGRGSMCVVAKDGLIVNMPPDIVDQLLPIVGAVGSAKVEAQ